MVHAGVCVGICVEEGWPVMRRDGSQSVENGEGRMGKKEGGRS